MINVGICFGGKSVEHDISIITYTQVESAINKDKYNVIPLYLDRDNNFYTFKKMNSVKEFKDNKGFKRVNFIRKKDGTYVRRKKLDCVVLVNHGKGLEDGTLASFFKMLNVPCTAPDIFTSATFHNKYLSKVILKENKIPVLNYYLVNKEKWESSDSDSEVKPSDNRDKIINSIYNELKSEVVIVKPVNLGSSIGVKVCKNRIELTEAIDKGFLYDNKIIVEKCLDEFREFNQAIYKYKENVVLSKIEEVVINNNDNTFYGFDEKYVNGNSTRILPAEISQNLKVKINKMTIKIQKIFDNIGVIRVDYLYNSKDKRLYVNEINVIPGALSYYLFEVKDIFFDDLIDNLIIEAVTDFLNEDVVISSFDSNVLCGKKMGKF